MAKYRETLPQSSNELFLTDGGIETTLIFDEVAEVEVWLSVMSSSIRAVYLTDSNYMKNYFTACGFVYGWN